MPELDRKGLSPKECADAVVKIYEKADKKNKNRPRKYKRSEGGEVVCITYEYINPAHLKRYRRVEASYILYLR